MSSHPVLNCAEAKAWEAGLLPDEAAEWRAMQEAGAALARAIEEDFKEVGGLPANARLLVLAGKGHNGGDALLAARALLAGRAEARAVVSPCFGAGELRPLAGRSLDWLKRDAPGRVVIVPAEQALLPSEGYDLCLDGIFGFQFRAPMDPAIAAVLATVNEHAGIRLRAAVDLPSGVGVTNADILFRADFTYATGLVKSPVLSPRVTSSVGRLRYLDLGFFNEGEPAGITERVLTPRTLTPLSVIRPSQTDKRTFGHLFVVGGSRSYPGAVVLAVRAALRSGVGLVTAFVPERLAPEYAARHPEAMWVGCPETANGSLAGDSIALIEERRSRATAFLVGPGLGADPQTLAWIGQLASEASVPLVFDADALRAEVMAPSRGKPFIGTPHAGEFQRIAPSLFAEGKFTAPHGVLVLKGPLTR
ncbi:MAG TPA: NAD(P)H-hydrate dehydratase, partial [Lacunisphaera sp.]|nr:NAD(P)H-hydrate dehydratase [Lacunisphaera sp.]